MRGGRDQDQLCVVFRDDGAGNLTSVVRFKHNGLKAFGDLLARLDQRLMQIRSVDTLTNPAQLRARLFRAAAGEMTADALWRLT